MRNTLSLITDIFAKMSGGKYFCTLDLYKAYLRMEVDDESASLQTISRLPKKEISKFTGSCSLQGIQVYNKYSIVFIYLQQVTTYID